MVDNGRVNLGYAWLILKAIPAIFAIIPLLTTLFTISNDFITMTTWTASAVHGYSLLLVNLKSSKKTARAVFLV